VKKFKGGLTLTVFIFVATILLNDYVTYGQNLDSLIISSNISRAKLRSIKLPYVATKQFLFDKDSLKIIFLFSVSNCIIDSVSDYYAYAEFAPGYVNKHLSKETAEKIISEWFKEAKTSIGLKVETNGGHTSYQKDEVWSYSINENKWKKEKYQDYINILKKINQWEKETLYPLPSNISSSIKHEINSVLSPDKTKIAYTPVLKKIRLIFADAEFKNICGLAVCSADGKQNKLFISGLETVFLKWTEDSNFLIALNAEGQGYKKAFLMDFR
jgi:hypothetical protein